jgi:hypothetical protein
MEVRSLPEMKKEEGRRKKPEVGCRKASAGWEESARGYQFWANGMENIPVRMREFHA